MKKLPTKISIVQTVMMPYRVPFFEALYELLKESDIHLEVIFSEENSSGNRKPDDLREARWAKIVPKTNCSFIFFEVVWQSVRKVTRGSDLVVMPQHNRLIANWLLMLFPFGRRTALWGHGKNFQQTTALRTILTRRLAVLPDWWFAYTEETLNIVSEAGFDKKRITILNNAIDTDALRKDIGDVSEDRITELRERIGANGAVGVYCGSLYKGKRIDFLLKSAKKIRASVSDFHLLIVGDGSLHYEVARAAKEYNWISYLGPKYGIEKAEYLALGDVFLMPYCVGLSVLDAFAAGMPLVTVCNGNHGPEISYVESGHNGYLTNGTVQAYADSVIGLLDSPSELIAMKENCRKDSSKYTVSKMAKHFKHGILHCISKKSI